MQKGCFTVLIIFCVIAIGLLAYFLGKKNGNKTIDNIAMNAALIKEIAELSSLEVQGTANIKTTNITNDGTLNDQFKKLFMERTVNISIPYVAKYGIDLSQQNVTIEEKNKTVFIVLPNPQLLSYELRLDRADAATRKGLLAAADENLYGSVEKKLYTASRGQLATNTAYQQQAKDKIRKLMEDYYAPMKFKVEVVYKDEIKSSIKVPLY